jgi:ABC-2 type transport system ATP-binding protein
MADTEKNRTNKDSIVIETHGLTRRFGTLVAVNKLDIQIHRGEVFGFLGPNGAGKSTLIRMLLGLLSPSEGSAKVLGYTMPSDAEKLRPHIGYMTQKFSLYEDLSVEENLEFAARIFGLDCDTKRKRIRHVIEEFGLEERIEQRPATMSGGWKQRLALATSTVHEPELLFLDEPTAGVDPDSRRLFWEKLFELSSQGTTILVSTHYMDEAVRCNRICMIREGQRSALGHPAELTAALKSRVVEISTSPIEEAIKLVCGLPEVESVTQLGNQIHVLLSPDAPRAETAVSLLLKHLQSADFKHIRARIAEPNLEDVFVAQAHGEKLIEKKEIQ